MPGLSYTLKFVFYSIVLYIIKSFLECKTFSSYFFTKNCLAFMTLLSRSIIFPYPSHVEYVDIFLTLLIKRRYLKLNKWCSIKKKKEMKENRYELY